MHRVLADRPRLAGFVYGFLGMLTACVIVVSLLFGYHLWTDHRALHVMLDFLNQHAEQIRKVP